MTTVLNQVAIISLDELPRQKTCHYHSDSSKVSLIIFYLNMLVYAMPCSPSPCPPGLPDTRGLLSEPCTPIQTLLICSIGGVGWIVTHNILEPDSKVLPSFFGFGAWTLDWDKLAHKSTSSNFFPRTMCNLFLFFFKNLQIAIVSLLPRTGINAAQS